MTNLVEMMKSDMTGEALMAEIERRLSALEEWQRVDNDIHTATPQPVTSEIRIRPDDTLTVEEQKEIRDYIRYRCGEGTIDMAKMPLWIVNIEEKLRLLASLSSPTPQPSARGREWNEGGYAYVWRAFMHNGKWIVDKIKLACLDGIYWQPVLDPNEPAPEGPCEVK